MFRLFVMPAGCGILAFLVVYFLPAAMVPEPGIVSYVADFAFNLSNACCETMPSIIASYIASLNLQIVALTVGLLLTVVVQLVVIIGAAFIGLLRLIISLLKKGKDEEVVRDLPPIDMDPKYLRSMGGGKIIGRGLDSLDRE